MSENAETTATEDVRVVAPKTVAELDALTEIKTTEAATSYANFMNRHLGHIEGWVDLTPEQAWTVIYAHRVWQSSEERAAEKAALVEAKEAEKAQRAEERAAKKAEREAEKARKDAEKERKAAERAAKKAAEGDASDDLDSVDAEGTDEIPTRRRRKKPAAVEVSEDTPTEGEGEIEGF